jgi:hypothetical protein
MAAGVNPAAIAINRARFGGKDSADKRLPAKEFAEAWLGGFFLTKKAN